MKLSVGKKLYIVFSLLLVLLIAMGIFSMVKMEDTNRKVKEITEQRMVAVETINNINYLTEHVLALSLHYVMEENKTDQEQFQKEMNQALSQVALAVAKYDKLIQPDAAEERQNFDTFKKEWQQYRTYHEDVLLLERVINLDKGAGVGKGQQIYQVLDTARTHYDVMQHYLEQLIRINHEASLAAAQQSEQNYQSGMINTIVQGSLAIIIAGVASVLLTRNIRGPLVQLEENVKQVALGNLAVEPVRIKNRDEIGSLAGSFNEMAAFLRTLIQQVGSGADQVAATSEQLMASSEQTSKATEQIASTVQVVAAGAEQQMNSGVDCFTAVNEMATGLQQVATHAQDVSHTAVSATELAEAGTNSVEKAVNQMNSIHDTISGLAGVVKGLGTRSEQIGEILEVINGISAQTNLLALNAAIEAARAGEHGRGFAVVADEVRKLAEQSGQSAQQISMLIESIQEETHQAVISMENGVEEVNVGIQVVHEAGASFKEIKESVAQVATQIQEVSAAVQQMSASSERVVETLEQIARVAGSTAEETQNVSAATQEQLAAMEEISASAAALARMGEELRDLVARFTV